MSSDLRVVIDTNVAVSAVLLRHSASRRAFDAAGAAGRLLISNDTIAELGEVLRRPKFSGYATTAIISEFLKAYVAMAQIVTVTEHITECRDPKDDKFLELAVAGTANYLITGDADLLMMNPFRGIGILRPQEFLNAIADR